MSVSVTERGQGRPPRGEGDVGRERLVEAARTVLRVGKPPDFSRKAVAEAAGVTPALVNYYFPDRVSLMLAATRPVVEAKIAELDGIIQAAGPLADKLKRIVALLVSLNETEAHLIDYTIECCRTDVRDPSQRAMLLGAYHRLRLFYEEGVSDGIWRPMDADVFLFALWGMCKYAAETHPRPPAGTQDGPDRRVEAVVELALFGLARR